MSNWFERRRRGAAMVARPRLKREGRWGFSPAIPAQERPGGAEHHSRAHAGRLTVAVMELEDYLKGVVPVEIGWGTRPRRP